MWRPAAKQTWPWNWNEAYAPADAAASRSASSSTTNALLPPSSSETFLSRPPGELADPPAGRGRARERHRVDVGVGDDRLADLRAADHDLEQPLGQPRLAEDRLEHRAAADRRLRVRLEDDGVAQRERRGDDPHAQHARRVPGRDRPDDADGDPPHHRQPARLPPTARASRTAASGMRRRVEQLLRP